MLMFTVDIECKLQVAGIAKESPLRKNFNLRITRELKFSCKGESLHGSRLLAMISTSAICIEYGLVKSRTEQSSLCVRLV